MHNAPSVIYPVGRCRFFAALLLLLALAALVLLFSWHAAVNDAFGVRRWAGWIGAGFWLVWGLWAIRSWRRSPQGRLEWDAHAPAVSLTPADGQGAWRWHDQEGGEAVRLSGIELAVDLQMLALLSLPGARRRRCWIWVERWRDPARWNDLRRALHSPNA
ncbi:hypothetical protein [Hydrogenophaga sp.]|jgi:hypothetical protein|uniref:hypothetical protein n=1 Tax=Hydrogenophaga sp. TaxID=1904254 RepID=UPI003F6FE439